MPFFGDKVLRRKDPRIKIKQIRKVSSGGLAQAKSHAKQAYYEACVQGSVQGRCGMESGESYKMGWSQQEVKQTVLNNGNSVVV